MNNKIKSITSGAMLVGFFGVLGIINLYTGTALDVFFAYIMILPITLYTYQKSIKEALCVLFATGVVLFIVGELFFMTFSCSTLLMGIYYGYALKSKLNMKVTYLGLLIISAIKNIIVFFIIGQLLGIAIFTEGIEMYNGLVNFIPFLKNVLSPNVSFALIWLGLIICEALVVSSYARMFLNRFLKKK